MCQGVLGEGACSWSRHPRWELIVLVPAQLRQEGGKQVSNALLGDGFQPSLLGGNMAESFYNLSGTLSHSILLI